MICLWTEKNKWVDGYGILGPIGECYLYLLREIGDTVRIEYVEKLPLKYPK